MTEDDSELPRAQYIDTQRVLVTMGRAGVRRITHLHPVQVFVLAMMGGFFIGMGALVSILLASGVGTPGPQRLLEGFGFSAGFFFVILSEAVLFSEANVMMPAALLENRGRSLLATLRFWILAFAGNLAEKPNPSSRRWVPGVPTPLASRIETSAPMPMKKPPIIARTKTCRGERCVIRRTPARPIVTSTRCVSMYCARGSSESSSVMGNTVIP